LVKDMHANHHASVWWFAVSLILYIMILVW